MHRYAFIHDFGDIFVIKAKNKANAINAFTPKVAGKFGFAKPYRRADVLGDIAFGFLTIKRVKEIR